MTPSEELGDATELSYKLTEPSVPLDVFIPGVDSALVFAPAAGVVTGDGTVVALGRWINNVSGGVADVIESKICIRFGFNLVLNIAKKQVNQTCACVSPLVGWLPTMST
jgi:hypothetical protein